jgi:hypothetical protein
MTITTYKKKNGGYISLWEHADKTGRAFSKTSPEQAERNAIKQAKNRGCEMVDYCGNPQGYMVNRKLYQEID